MMEDTDKTPKIQLEQHSKSISDSLDFHNRPTLTLEEEKKTWRKIDLRLMPILALMYLLSFLDRGGRHIFLSFHFISPGVVGNIGNDRG